VPLRAWATLLLVLCDAGGHLRRQTSCKDNMVQRTYAATFPFLSLQILYIFSLLFVGRPFEIFLFFFCLPVTISVRTGTGARCAAAAVRTVPCLSLRCWWWLPMVMRRIGPLAGVDYARGGADGWRATLYTRCVLYSSTPDLENGHSSHAFSALHSSLSARTGRWTGVALYWCIYRCPYCTYATAAARSIYRIACHAVHACFGFCRLFWFLVA